MSSPIADPIQAGLAAGLKVIDASTLSEHRSIEADVAIIGSGAEGGVSAEILTLAGLHVVLIEEGPLKSSTDFKMREADAYPALYQESAARKTKDKAINILKVVPSAARPPSTGPPVSVPPPDTMLDYWQKQFGLQDYTKQALAPWFAMMEQRLNVAPWQTAPNENNAILQRGATKLGISTARIPRNVKGCWNLGYCGMGCPTNAKQSMLVTTIPSALSHGATLLTRTRADKLVFRGDTVQSLNCVALDASDLKPSGHNIAVRAKHYVVAGGAINSPALLMRSKTPDPQHLLRKRTFLHPMLISTGLFAQKVDGFDGAPQTIYSDHFLGTQPVDGPMRYKLEVPPLHPLPFSTTMPGFGSQHAAMMKQFPHTHAMLALLRDGFNEGSVGGTVQLRDDGSPVLDYPFTVSSGVA